MPKAQSKAQQQAAGAALAAKRGELNKSELEGASIEMFESMDEDALEELASNSHEDLPDTADEE